VHDALHAARDRGRDLSVAAAKQVAKASGSTQNK